MPNTVRRRALVLIAFLSACGGDAGENRDTTDATIRDILFPTDTLTDSQVDTAVPVDSAEPDTGDAADIAETDTGPCVGFGCACQSNADCLDELCIESADGFVCTKPCLTECPSGYDCLLVSGLGPDPQSVCVPQHVRLCRPCRTDAECASPLSGGISPGLCLPAADPREGSFCGSSCEGTTLCPAGFECQDIPREGGTSTRQCVPTSGLCECRAAWAGASWETTCVIANALGECVGSRGCVADGLGDCVGQTPAVETCNGIDDDCNGVTDEVAPEACPITNGIGTCVGTRGCEAGAPICTGRAASVESCNGVDDDCDASTDEGTCDDGIACTVDVCHPLDGCTHAVAEATCFIDGACYAAGDKKPGDPCRECIPDVTTVAWSDGVGTACDDRDPCTKDDQCNAGRCGGVPYVCDDGLGCTSDACDGVGGCTASLRPGQCLIDNSCYANGQRESLASCRRCDSALAPTAWSSNDGALCNDGQACTRGDTCVGTACVGSAYSCDDGLACTDDVCLGDGTCGHAPSPGSCFIGGACYAPGAVKAGEPCLACRPELSTSTWSPIEGTVACNDGNACTSNDTCSAGTCVGTPYVCNDSLACTNDSCNGDGSCTFAPNGSACVIGGTCVASGTTDPQNACRQCTPASSATSYSDKPQGTSCNDGQGCTKDDKCNAGSCGGTAYTCNDNLACTSDSCNGAGGCTFTATTGCAIGGQCIAADAFNPQNPCEQCLPAVSTTAWSPNSGASCNDGQSCTHTDKCVAGTCVGTAYSCNDNLTCTSDVCNGAGGCSYPLNAGNCLINNSCYGNAATQPGNVCYRCNTAQSTTSWSFNNGVSCNDADSCTSADSCLSGQCVGNPVVDVYEPNNARIGSYIPNVGDCDDIDARTLNATVVPTSSDVDWYRYKSNDDSCNYYPYVTLSDIPATADLDLEVFFSCANGANPLDYKFECNKGTRVTSPDGLPGCRSAASGTTAEAVELDVCCTRAFGINCTGDDSGWLDVRVYKFSGTTNCNQSYRLGWGDN